MSQLIEVSSHKSFGGVQKVFKHHSTEVNCQMTFTVYIPPSILGDDQDGHRRTVQRRLPVLYWTPGYGSTWEWLITKTNYQRYASLYNLVVVGVDSRPRVDHPDYPPDDPSTTTASLTVSGLYADATQEPWSRHYRMHSYVTKEIPSLIEREFSKYVIPGRKSIMGHSMGGHAALCASLRNPSQYLSVSAFAPVAHPTGSIFGRPVFREYLGDDEDLWKEWDASCLVERVTKGPRDKWPDINLLVDLGTDDPIREHLGVDHFFHVCKETGFPIEFRCHDGYDHDYHFISTFMEDHVRHHARILHS